MTRRNEMHIAPADPMLWQYPECRGSKSRAPGLNLRGTNVVRSLPGIKTMMDARLRLGYVATIQVNNPRRCL